MSSDLQLTSFVPAISVTVLPNACSSVVRTSSAALVRN